jgi:hypothetical protein
MKKLLTLLIFSALFTFPSCQKDEIGKCQKCTVYLVNSELYTYQMTMTGQESFPILPAEVKEIEIETGETYTITGKPNTFYAHNDFSRSVKCEGGCGDLIVEIKN